MGFAAFTFFFIFLLIASGGLILFYREAMIQRISAVITPRAKQGTFREAIEQTGSTLGSMVEQFERVIPKSSAEISVVEQRLIRAGYRSDSAVKLFYGAKVLVPVIFCFVAFVTGAGSYGPFFVYLIAIGLGFLAPDFWLGNRIAARQARIRRGLPDVLDLLVICIEAGLSLDQSVARTADELSLAQPAICDELSIVVLEQRAGLPRADAWKHFCRTHKCGKRPQPSFRIGAVREIRDKRCQDIARSFGHPQDPASSESRGASCEDNSKTRLPARAFYLSFTLFGNSWSGGYYRNGKLQ